MSEIIEIEVVGTLHKIRDPNGSSYRFVAKDGELTSAIIFCEGDILDQEEVVRYKNVKFTVTFEIDEDSKEYGLKLQ